MPRSKAGHIALIRSSCSAWCSRSAARIGGIAAVSGAAPSKGAPACISAPSTVASQFVVPPPQQKPVTPSLPLDAACAFTKRALFSMSVRSFAWSSRACIARPSSSLPG